MAKLIPWLLVLLQATAVLGATWGLPFTDKKPNTRQTGKDVKPAVDYHPDGQHHGDYGANHYNAAMRLLRSIPRMNKQSPKDTSIFSTALQYVIKTLPTGPASAPSSHHHHHQTGVSGTLAEATKALEDAVAANSSDALYLLADMNFFGYYNHPRDLNKAFQLYESHSEKYGNASAQYMLGVYYSTGLAGVVAPDQAKALLHHTFAAAGGSLRSEMAVAYRHFAGVGAIKSFDKAVAHYKRVADKAIEWYRSGPPGGRTWVVQGWRIADDDGGVYGEGASASSAGINAFRPNLNSDQNAAIGDVIEYLDLMSQKGDYKAAFNLGRIYYEGQRGLERNLDMARKYFWAVTTRYWKRDGRIVENYKPGIEKTACKAAAYLGRMYLRGEGVSQDFDKARIWFERGITHGDPLAQYGLGLMHLHGYLGKVRIQKAMSLLKVAADQDFAPAQVEMGRLHLDQGSTEDLRVANNYFELAARYGNIEANYHLAEMVHHSVGREKICAISLSYYKSVAEKAEPLVSSWADANVAYEAGDYETAFLGYLLAAEQGYERAQTNVAYMLDWGNTQLPAVNYLRQRISGSKPHGGLLNNSALALVQWTRSSRQSNIDSMVKMGDYYYYGIGTEKDISKAVQCYTSASDHSQSAQALYNLGWMHEHGVGLKQDYHLAKRYYDHALMVNKEAYLPVTLSLLKLRIRSAWNTLTHGEIHGIQEEPNARKDWSLSDWIAHFIDQADDYIYDEDGYYDDYFDDTMGGGDGEYDDAGIVESVLILGVMTALIFLLWWRQRLQQAHAQREDERRREQGLPPMPPPAQPAPGNGFAGWAGGGMGL